MDYRNSRIVPARVVPVCVHHHTAQASKCGCLNTGPATHNKRDTFSIQWAVDIMNVRHLASAALTFSLIVPFWPRAAASTASPDTSGNPPVVIPDYYQRAAQRTRIAWWFLAGLDSYGGSIRPPVGIERPKGIPPLRFGFRFSPWEWAGLYNPQPGDQSPLRITLFQGRGMDGDGDGRADQDNPYDRSVAIATWLTGEGTSEQDVTNVLWKHFSDPEAVERIIALTRVYGRYGTTELGARAFPLHKRYSYSLKDTWGEARSFGGKRSHEGTDLFAGYGTPVISVCYGYVELIGWNRLGGWRIGLRSADNTYFYYAHLSSFVKGLKQGMIVRPGQVIAYVGSSGYGKPGTSGKFPPHLHFGIYKDTGKREWAMDPYPYLRRWERQPQIVIYPAKPKQSPAEP